MQNNTKTLIIKKIDRQKLNNINISNLILRVLTSFFTIFNKIFPQKYFCYTHVLMNPSFMQSISKKNISFWIYSIGNRLRWQQHLQREAHNVEVIIIISILYSNAQD